MVVFQDSRWFSYSGHSGGEPDEMGEIEDGWGGPLYHRQAPEGKLNNTSSY